MKENWNKKTIWAANALGLLTLINISNHEHFFLRIEAGLGFSQAQYELGNRYDRRGDFLRPSYQQNHELETAAKWYRAAADKRFAPAKEKMGEFYYRGYGVKEDNSEAMKWHCKAADQGNGEAQENIGLMYMRGIGVQRDYAESFFWLSLARKSGVDIRNNLNDVSPKDSEYNPDTKLTPRQIESVKKRIEEWKPISNYK